MLKQWLPMQHTHLSNHTSEGKSYEWFSAREKQKRDGSSNRKGGGSPPEGAGITGHQGWRMPQNSFHGLIRWIALPPTPIPTAVLVQTNKQANKQARKQTNKQAKETQATTQTRKHSFSSALRICIHDAMEIACHPCKLKELMTEDAKKSTAFPSDFFDIKTYAMSGKDH